MGNKKVDFEKNINLLEEIVNELETGNLTLDKSLEKFTEGVKLVKQCNQELNKAEKKIEMVLKEKDENTRIVPFGEGDEE